ncbi:MAG: PrsW family intramembrane metalloprotease [Melioribacteraceae bacterium]|nr:PrsW family intramembrane metalloprotease [Melioribacteraceae bacterium]MCF8264565.1 PrsW family intramembrane metalloprotease [Melioribacteraceae bacterium]MCF8413527.1 PrsW family intramembrane metalloprotease [Melioribacteraceae bacterium]MCF8432763.1 PrsW family intramembrane metalloprotease [Melioribacteraceae bacterium]
MAIIFSVLPVVLFIVFLFFMESFKIIKISSILFCLLWGLVAAGFSFDINNFFIGLLNIPAASYSHFVAPIVEEVLKILLIAILIQLRKVGFIVDGAIMGFASGAGFSIMENIYYFQMLENPDPLVWVMRGLGAAVMHGGATSIVAIFVMNAYNSEKKNYLKAYLPGLLIAVIIHSLYNQFIIQPYLTTMLTFILIPSIIILIFTKNQSDLQKWMDDEFDTETNLLTSINKGEFSKTRGGMFIVSMKSQFPPEVFFDMLVYTKLYLELSVKAKGVMFLQENDLPVEKDPTIKTKLDEMKELEKNIGKTGLLALTPILRMSKKDIWKLKMLEKV